MEPVLAALCPRPRQLTPGRGTLPLLREPTVALHACAGTPAAAQLARLLQEARLAPAIEGESESEGEGAWRIDLRLGEGPPGEEAYRLAIDETGVTLHSHTAAGLFYGVCTLGQLLALGRQADCLVLPCLRIEDSPSFARRGVMLDISRDKVPTLATLLGLVDLLASLKINELQLYMEHTFAYAGHEAVWREASPLTGPEVETLDRYCRERHVELVPNQNSFGHMQRWLSHEPYRRDLAEAPDGFEHAWNPTREPYGLCPTEPRSLAFLNGLYDQLLPHFTSRTFNVGLDETFDLGLGRSKAACAARGTERVYLDFLTQLHAAIARRGFTMQFWGDIIIKRPELIPELPRDAIAMEWGYEHDHPFDEHLAKFAAAGLRFYVCPGTSSWNTIGGRTENALLNIASAVKQGVAHGALGVLNTDWGDNGHLQPLSVSYLGFVAGAAMSWNAADALAPLELPVAEWLEAHVFDDAAGLLGEAARDLGNAYRELGFRPHNSSALFYFVAGRSGQPLELPGVKPEHFERALAYLLELDLRLARAEPSSDEARRSQSELVWASDLLKAACRIGRARLAVGLGAPLSKLSSAERHALAAELEPLIERHRGVWLERNRPGGLADSAKQMENVLEQLRA